MRRLVASLLVSFVVSAAPHAGAQSTPGSGTASSAAPNLSGIWHRKGPLNGKPNAPMAPTNRALGYEKAFDNALSPTYDCVQIPVPAVMNDDYDFQVTQQPDRVIIRYEKMDVVRTIWLEGAGHPSPGPYDYTTQGHSVGRYEGGQIGKAHVCTPATSLTRMPS